MKLTAKQQRFVDEYLIDLNATQAAIRAGYSEKTAQEQASRLLSNVMVRQAIEQRKKDREKRTEITQDKVLNEISKIAFGDARNVMSWGPDGLTLKDSEEISDTDAAFVAEVSETTTEHGGTLKLKTNDKLKALELLGKHLGLFKENIELTGKNGTPIQSVSVNMDPEQFIAAAKKVAEDI